MKSTLSPLERLIAARVTVIRHFEGSEVPRDSPCWESTYKVNSAGYAVIGWEKSTLYAYHLSYERWVGERDKSRQIDHLCNNRACWNPAHLHQKPQADNIARGFSPGANAVRTDMCKRGHSLADAYVNNKGHRACRTCMTAYMKERYDGMKNGTWVPLRKRPKA